MKYCSMNLVNYRFKWMDVFILIIMFAVLYSILTLGASMNAPFSIEDQEKISLAPLMLPYYAGRSLLRMFIAFAASLLFTLVYGYIAAKSQKAEKIMIPLLDILQSVPVLGFLSATITMFIALFPGKIIGVECAAILAIFTGQAWNMTFSFYHSLLTVPKDLQEVADVLGMNWWQKFIKLEVPFSVIGLVWNSMMSFGGGWFFLAASEAITVLGQNIRLPGVGSYLATAIEEGNLLAIGYSIFTMILMIVFVDQIFWRPLVVWSQKFKIELTEAADLPSSFVYDAMKKSKVLCLCYRFFSKFVLNKINNYINKMVTSSTQVYQKYRKYSQVQWLTFLLQLIVVIGFICFMIQPVYQAYILVTSMDHKVLVDILGLGFFTFGRVLLAVLLGVVWTVPVGVWIGLNPKWSKLLQPIIQIVASFPANMMFPFITILFLNYHINFEFGSVALMMLGTQWYILFNVIAGAMSIPNDLHEAGAVFKLRGWLKWKVLILPSIFPYLITGIITASGGAWNASIVSEIVYWHANHLVATGLGAYISQVTEIGDWAGIIWGITVMCLFVIVLNRFLWRRLYKLAEEKYHIG